MNEMEARALTLPGVVAARLVGASALRNVLLIVGASLLLALSAQVAIPVPFSPVPLTMQPLALLLLGGALGSWRAAAAAALYLVEGASGLPVFAQGRGGLIVLYGPTAGYLYAFPLAAAIAGWAAEKGWTRSPFRTLPAMALALATIHLGGWAWLVAGMQLDPAAAFFTGVMPFLANDVVKVLIAAALLPAAESIVARFSA